MRDVTVAPAPVSSRPAVTPLAPRRPGSPGRSAWRGPAALGLAVVGAALAVGGPEPGTSGLVPTCVLRERLGWDCPGCGGTRALHALLHGDLVTAVDHNLVVALLVPLIVVACIGWALRARRIGSPDLPRAVVPAVLAVGVVAVLFGLARNVEGVALLEHLASSA